MSTCIALHGVGAKEVSVDSKCSHCLPCVNHKVFATNPGVLHLLPTSMKLCLSNPMTCEKGNTSGPSWLSAAQLEPEAGISDRNTAPQVSSTVDTLFFPTSASLEHHFFMRDAGYFMGFNSR